MSTKGQFLKNFVEILEGTEVPVDFALWSGLSAVSASLSRNVWLDMGIFTIYPNMLVVLVAGAGQCRKSTAIDFAEKILRLQTNPPNFVGQKATPEALIDSLRLGRGDTTQVRLSHTGFAMVDELVNFVNRRSYEAGLTDLLVPLFDCKDSFEYRTKARGIEQIEKACFGMLGGTTVDLIRDKLPREIIGSGLTSRMIFVFVETPNEPVPLPFLSARKQELLVECGEAVDRIARVSGQIVISPRAKTYFEKTYIAFYKTSPLYQIKTLKAYASRRYVYLLKVAMVLAMSQEEGMTLELRHLEGADEILSRVELKLHRVTELITSTGVGVVKDEVQEFIRKVGRVSRSVVLQKFSHQISSRELSEVILTLLHSEQIRPVLEGRAMFYEPV
jgi:hypothetical protein